ncbi:MAG: VWA domain-containing protein [Verrucomicrobiota bacterium]
MTFLAIKFLYFLLLLPALVALKLWADWRAHRVQELFTAPRLRDSLISGVSGGRTWFIFALQLISLAAFIIALARPVWGEDKVVQQESGRNIIIAIDTSRSMLANDVVPDRLTRAKLAIQDLLPALKNDRVGLIAFAGNAYLQAPLTTDHDAVIEAVQSLDFTSVPRGGSELGRALKLAIETFEKSPARNHGLILFSDGGEPDAEIAAYAQMAAKKSILVLTVGVGTEGGALIPEPDPDRAGDFVRDNQGNVVKTKLEPGALQEIATATRGRYLKLGSQPLAEGVVRDLVTSLQAQTNAARELVKPIERFYWPLSIGVLLLLAAWFIRPSARMKTPPSAPAVFALLTVMALGPDAQAAEASWLGAIFSSKQVEPAAAHDAYGKGDFEHAAKLYDDLLKEKTPARQREQYAFGLGASAHQLKDYDRAVGGFSQALESADTTVQNHAHRGLAHSLYDQGDKALAKQPKFTLKAWRDSVKHFDASLAIEPGNKEVKENREFVQKRLDQLQQQMNQQQQKGGKGNKGDKKKGQKGQKGEKGESGEDQDGEKGENGDQDGEGEGDEDKSRKESLGKKDGEEEGEGAGEKEKEKEGQLQAGEQGKDESPEARESREQREAEMAENHQNEATGFSRNEARSFLRTYADDQKKAMVVRPRDEPVKGKDW